MRTRPSYILGALTASLVLVSAAARARCGPPSEICEDDIPCRPCPPGGPHTILEVERDRETIQKDQAFEERRLSDRDVEPGEIQAERPNPDQ